MVLLFPKTGLCAEQKRRGAMVDFHFSLQRVNNENNRRRLGRAELGKLWSWRGDQPEIEGALAAATSSVDSSASKSSIRRFVITEKAPTRAFSWLKAATTHSVPECGFEGLK